MEVEGDASTRHSRMRGGWRQCEREEDLVRGRTGRYALVAVIAGNMTAQLDGNGEHTQK